MAHSRSRIAFYYGNAGAPNALGGFDVAVVEPGFNRVLYSPGHGHTQWLAYLSLGEALESQPYFNALPKEWLVSKNATWRSHIIDQSASEWPEFLARQIAQPLWQAGYGGFFLDTVDAYLRLAPGVRQDQQAGAAESILRLREAYPQSVIILNRGFELLPETHRHIDAIAFESLYRGWDESTQHYVPVPRQDRQWLLAQSAMAQSYGLPVIAIDYCPPQDLASARITADKIRSHNIVPYVGDGHLLTIPAASLNKARNGVGP
ncbi:hypothetical protein CDEF62S_01747 [Castellaniella defragrans]